MLTDSLETFLLQSIKITDVLYAILIFVPELQILLKIYQKELIYQIEIHIYLRYSTKYHLPYIHMTGQVTFSWKDSASTVSHLSILLTDGKKLFTT